MIWSLRLWRVLAVTHKYGAYVWLVLLQSRITIIKPCFLSISSDIFLKQHIKRGQIQSLVSKIYTAFCFHTHRDWIPKYFAIFVSIFFTIRHRLMRVLIDAVVCAIDFLDPNLLDIFNPSLPPNRGAELRLNKCVHPRGRISSTSLH